jgi:hypothetical protein
MTEMSNSYRILVGKPEGKRPFGRPRRKCEYIRMVLKGNRVGRCACSYEHGNEPSDSMRGRKLLDQLGDF